MVSVILLTYNSGLRETILSLESIVNQKHHDFEIIISDDSSLYDNFVEIETYFKGVGFERYRLVKQEKNIGTVKNFLSACKIARGQYVKGLGSGDLLYSPDTLSDVHEFMLNNNSNMTFGLLHSYCQQTPETISYLKFSSPRNLQPYCKKNNNIIGLSMLLLSDWISGASMFFKKAYLIDLLSQLQSHVTYCEDLIQVLVVLRGEPIDFYSKHVLWYEYGTGISSSNSGVLSNKMKLDHVRFFDFINELYPCSKLLKARTHINFINENINSIILKKACFVLVRFFYSGDVFFSLNKKNKKSIDYPDNSGFLCASNFALFAKRISLLLEKYNKK